MKLAAVFCVVFAGVALALPRGRVKRSPQKTIVEVIPVEVYEVPPIPSVLAFDFDAARAGKVYSPPVGSEDKAEEKKEVTKRDESATERKQKEKEEAKEGNRKFQEGEELSPEEQIDVRVDEDKGEKAEETPKE